MGGVGGTGGVADLLRDDLRHLAEAGWLIDAALRAGRDRQLPGGVGVTAEVQEEGGWRGGGDGGRQVSLWRRILGGIEGRGGGGGGGGGGESFKQGARFPENRFKGRGDDI